LLGLALQPDSMLLSPTFQLDSILLNLRFLRLKNIKILTDILNIMINIINIIVGFSIATRLNALKFDIATRLNAFES
jgi:hypothetical protein